MKNDDNDFGEIDLWEKIKESVKPLRNQIYYQSNNITGKKTNKPIIKQIATEKISYKMVTNKVYHKNIDLEEGNTSNVDKSTSKKFLKGNIKIDAKLDLHGKNLNIASLMVYNFVKSNYKSKKRCLLIITGKGNCILKNETPRWLNSDNIKKYLLMFSKAQPKDGGDGALYVYLKKNKDTNPTYLSN